MLLLASAGCVGDWSRLGVDDAGVTKADEAGATSQDAESSAPDEERPADPPSSPGAMDASDDRDARVEPDARAESDAGSNDAGTSADGGDGALDDGGDAAAPRTAAIASVDMPCSVGVELACSAQNAVQKLACVGNKWSFNGSCDGATRCDTRVGVSQGTCQAITTRCLGKQPGAAICDGTDRKQCGVDLLEELPNPCPALSHCEGADASCACDRGYVSGPNGCVDIPDCPENACSNGRCVEGVESFSCACDSGYRPAPDGKSCVDIPDCAPGICGTGGKCSEGTNDYSCTCDPGSEKKPGAKACSDIDDCASMPCGPPEIGICRDEGAHANSCTCVPGFEILQVDATHQSCTLTIIVDPCPSPFGC